ncbi:MAG: MurR/RpiR family transcriptional regulator [Bilifractor sp.]|jgi:DNA-binding MurR/RpiR family transcriptional regulator
MNVLQNLIGLYDHLMPDSTYRSVIKNILTHLPEAAESNIYELADLTDSSRTTIRRMLSMLGYENYQDFHYELRQAVHHYPYYNRLMDTSRLDDGGSFIRKVSEQLEATRTLIQDTFQEDALTALARQIREADKVCFFFPYHTAAINSFQQNLAMTGVETCVAELPPEIMLYADTLTSRSMVFSQTIEHAETMDMTPVFRKIRQSGAYVILLSSRESQYAEYVDQQLFQGFDIPSALGSVLLSETFILTLSEIYRRLYLDTKPTSASKDSQR